jgi:hypothetical protein
MPRPKRTIATNTDAAAAPPASKRSKAETDKDAATALKKEQDEAKANVAPAQEPVPVAAAATTEPESAPAATTTTATPLAVAIALAKGGEPAPAALKADPATAATTADPATAAAPATATAAPATAVDSKPPPKKRAPAGVSGDKIPTDPAYFNDYIFQLLLFKAGNNNFHVTKEENASVHAFLQHLKKEYKAYSSDPTTSVLSEEQMKVLEFLHVPLTSRGDDHWNRFYELLQQYGERHGHVLVPRLCEVPGLGDWVTDQRRQYKAWKQGQPSQLTKERREKLQGIGFAWQVRNRPEWEHRYQELLEYKAKNNDCKVPQHFKENRALGKWVAKQREQFKLLKKGQHSFLTPYRLEKLNAVGFVWQIRTALEGEEEEVSLAAPVAVAVAVAPAVVPAPVPVAVTEASVSV